MAQEDVFKKIVSHCKEYGFVFPSSEIYDGLGAVYDYGQNGVELKNNIKQYWSGINLSKIRGSMEPLAKGGTASGPVSFMRGADSWAGTIKSGGKTRRAAKMVVLDVDHPDIRHFIWCKAKEEDKAEALARAGFDMSIRS